MYNNLFFNYKPSNDIVQCVDVKITLLHVFYGMATRRWQSGLSKFLIFYVPPFAEEEIPASTRLCK